MTGHVSVSPGRAPRKALIVEDHDEAARWLSDALRLACPDAEITLAGNLSSGMAQLRQSRPEVMIADLGLPDGSGIDLVAQARSREPPPVVVVATIYDDDEHLLAALRAGACGYLLKEASREVLARQIGMALECELPLAAAVAQKLMAHFSRRSASAPLPEPLTAKELEVLQALASDLTLGEVGEKLGVSRNTVHTHVSRIYAKLGVSSRVEATLVAARLGLVRL